MVCIRPSIKLVPLEVSNKTNNEVVVDSRTDPTLLYKQFTLWESKVIFLGMSKICISI